MWRPVILSSVMSTQMFMLLFCCSNVWVVSYVGWNCVTWTPECLEEAANYTANSAGDQLFPDVLSYVQLLFIIHWSCTHGSRRPHVAYDGIVCGCPKPWAMTYNIITAHLEACIVLTWCAHTCSRLLSLTVTCFSTRSVSWHRLRQMI